MGPIRPALRLRAPTPPQAGPPSKKVDATLAAFLEPLGTTLTIAEASAHAAKNQNEKKFENKKQKHVDSALGVFPTDAGSNPKKNQLTRSRGYKTLFSYRALFSLNLRNNVISLSSLFLVISIVKSAGVVFRFCQGPWHTRSCSRPTRLLRCGNKCY